MTKGTMVKSIMEKNHTINNEADNETSKVDKIISKLSKILQKMKPEEIINEVKKSCIRDRGATVGGV